MSPTSHRIPLILAFTALVTLGHTACVGEPDEEYEDPIDDSFLSGGKEDAFGYSEASYEADAVLLLANTLSEAALRDDLRIGSRARNAIVVARGAGEIATLSDFDAVAWVGTTVFGRFLAWATDHDLLGQCGDGDVQARVEECDGGAHCDNLCQLPPFEPVFLPHHATSGVELFATARGGNAFATVLPEATGMRVVTYTSAGVLVRSWWVPGSIPVAATMTDYGDVLVGSHSLGGGPRSVTRFATGGAVEELELEVEIDLGYIAELSTGELLISAWAAEPTPWGDFVFENGFVTVLDIDSHDPLVSFPDAWIVRDDDGAHWLDKRRLDDATLTLGESHASYPYDLIGWPGGGVGFLTDATPAQVPDVPAADVSNYRALWRDVGAGLDPVLVAVVRRHHMIVGTGDGGYWGIQWNIQLWRTTFTRYFANSPLTTSYEISVAGYLEGTPTLVPSTNELLVGLTRAGAQELGSPELQPNSRIIPTILRPL